MSRGISTGKALALAQVEARNAVAGIDLGSPGSPSESNLFNDTLLARYDAFIRAAYKFTESSGASIPDHSGRDNDAAVNGTPNQNPAAGGIAFAVNPGDYVRADLGASFAPKKGHSWTCTFKFRGTTPGSGQSFFTWARAANSYIGIGNGSSSGYLNFFYRQGGSVVTPFEVPAFDLYDGNDHRLTLRYHEPAKEVSIWYDGEKGGNSTLSLIAWDFANNGGLLDIGNSALAEGGLAAVPGTYSEFYFWVDALDQHAFERLESVVIPAS